MLHRGMLSGPAGPRQDTDTDTGPPPDWPRRLADLAASARDPRLRAYYAAGVPAADTPLADVPLAALDIETTGLDPRQHEIVSIGLVPLTLAQIHTHQTRHWVVRPRRGLVPESVAFHGITDTQIGDAPDLDDVLATLLEAMAGRVMVVHCRQVERGFFDAALRTRLGEGLSFPVLDTMALEIAQRPAAGFWGQRRREPPPSVRLADCRRRRGLPLYRAHHAPTDALASAELLLAQVADRYTPQTPVGELWR